jgi:hypothetical protein
MSAELDGNCRGATDKAATIFRLPSFANSRGRLGERSVDLCEREQRRVLSPRANEPAEIDISDLLRVKSLE